MTMVGIEALVDPRMLVEIGTIARALRPRLRPRTGTGADAPSSAADAAVAQLVEQRT